MAKQSNKKKKSFIAVVRLTPYPSRIIDLIEHHVADTAGLTYHEGYLYMVSDKEDLLIKYDIQKKETVQKVKLKRVPGKVSLLTIKVMFILLMMMEGL